MMSDRLRELQKAFRRDQNDACGAPHIAIAASSTVRREVAQLMLGEPTGLVHNGREQISHLPEWKSMIVVRPGDSINLSGHRNDA